MARGNSGFIFGLGLGAALGVLFAPKSGRKTREELANNLNGMLNSVKENFDGAVDQGSHLAQTAKKTVERTKDQVAGAYDAGQQAYRDAKKATA